MKNIFAILLLLTLLNCDSNRECTLTNVNCGETTYKDDTESATLGSNNNWTAINSSATVVKYPTTSNNAMSFADGPGTSVAYRSDVFPANLKEAGCDIIYKVALSGANSSDKSIMLYNNGSYFSSTVIASFKLNSTQLITGNTGFKTITVPVQLAANGTLPSNAYGKWEIAPSTTPQEDAAKFNQLIQNISGIAFPLDVAGSSPVWHYDDLSIKTCCPNY